MKECKSLLPTEPLNQDKNCIRVSCFHDYLTKWVSKIGHLHFTLMKKKMRLQDSDVMSKKSTSLNECNNLVSNLN